MRFLIVADPLAELNAAADTGLSILRSSLERGHEVFWAGLADVTLAGREVEVHAGRALECPPKQPPRMADSIDSSPIAEFDMVWIRKDPPVDWRYISLCWLLALEERDTVIVNSPALLGRLHEKMVPFEAFRAGHLRADEIIPTYLVTGFGRGSFPREERPDGWISKPWLGHGGRGIERHDTIDGVREALATRALESSPDDPESWALVQPFHPAVTRTGDRRLFYIDGDYVGDFARFPAEGSIEANLARGGSARLVPLSENELDTVRRLGDYLGSVGIVLAGADMIDGRITEVNITAPTGFEVFEELTGERLGDRLVKHVEGLVGGR